MTTRLHDQDDDNDTLWIPYDIARKWAHAAFVYYTDDDG